MCVIDSFEARVLFKYFVVLGKYYPSHLPLYNSEFSSHSQYQTIDNLHFLVFVQLDFPRRFALLENAFHRRDKWSV